MAMNWSKHNNGYKSENSTRTYFRERIDQQTTEYNSRQTEIRRSQK
jgi:hypothetical protein